MRPNEDDEEELIDENLQELITNTKKFFNGEFQRVEFIRKEEIQETEKEIKNLIGLPPEIREEINKEYQTAVETQNQQTNVLHQEPILKEIEESIQFDPEVDKFQIDVSEFQWKEAELSKSELTNPETSQTEALTISDQPQTYDEWLESLSIEELKQITRAQNQEIQYLSWMYQNEWMLNEEYQKQEQENIKIKQEIDTQVKMLNEKIEQLTEENKEYEMLVQTWNSFEELSQENNCQKAINE